MGSLYHEKTALRVHLEAMHSIGRSERASLRLDDPRVSLEHASLRWEGEQWILRDLGSLNRTFVDGVPLAAGHAEALAPGARVAFGADDLVWLFDDAAPPRVMAVPLSGGPAAVEDGGLLALPSAENPVLTIYRNEVGAWELDPQPSGRGELGDQSLIEVLTEKYRVCIPQPTKRTEPVHGLLGARVAELAITFRVSPDLDDIEVAVRRGVTETCLPARSHFELLRVLARVRRADSEQNLPEPNCGWLHVDDLAKKIKQDIDYVNVQIFRIRSQFAALGLVDPAGIVERRPRGRLVRFGIAASAEVPL